MENRRLKALASSRRRYRCPAGGGLLANGLRHPRTVAGRVLVRDLWDRQTIQIDRARRAQARRASEHALVCRQLQFLPVAQAQSHLLVGRWPPSLHEPGQLRSAAGKSLVASTQG